MPRQGETVLYRPVPIGFEETFLRVGWTSIEDECRVHAKTVKKWLRIVNEDRASRGLSSIQQVRAERVRRTGPAMSPTRVDRVMRNVRKRKRSKMAVTAVSVEA